MSIFIELLNHVKTVYPEYDPFPIDEEHPILKIYRSILTHEEAEVLINHVKKLQK